MGRIVVSTHVTLDGVLLAGDLATEITNLKASEQKGLSVVGSGGLVKSLAGQGPVDEYDLFLHPLVPGKREPLVRARPAPDRARARGHEDDHDGGRHPRLSPHRVVGPRTSSDMGIPTAV